MPNIGMPRLQQLLDHRHRIDAGRRRIAGAVRQEHAVGLQRHDLVEAWSVAGTTVTRAPASTRLRKMLSLGAVIDRDDMRALGVAQAAPA